MTKEKLVSLNIRDIPEELKRKFKCLCAGFGITLHDAVIQILKKSVREKKLDI